MTMVLNVRFQQGTCSVPFTYIKGQITKRVQDVIVYREISQTYSAKEVPYEDDKSSLR